MHTVGHPALDKNIIGQSQLNCMEWRKSGNKKTRRLKEVMSKKWKEMGQNLKISDAKLTGFEDKHRGDNEKCMNSVITEWFEKTSDNFKVYHDCTQANLRPYNYTNP